MSLVKTGSIKKSKAWKGIFQDKNTPTIEKPKSKKIPSTEKCKVQICILRRLQKFGPIVLKVLTLLSNVKTLRTIGSKFFGLLRKPEL